MYCTMHLIKKEVLYKNAIDFAYIYNVFAYINKYVIGLCGLSWQTQKNEMIYDKKIMYRKK